MQENDLRGARLLNFVGHALTSVQQRGFLRTCSYYLGGQGLRGLTWLWRVRKFWYWYWSPFVSEQQYKLRDAICGACEEQDATKTGKRYCGPCHCGRWHYAELTIKNRREGHFCPLKKFPEQMRRAPKTKPGGCKGKGCGGGKKLPQTAAGRNGRGRTHEDWHRNSGLLAVSTRGRA